MICHIEPGCPVGVIDKSVSGKHTEQTAVLKGQCPALTNAPHQRANTTRKSPVKKMVNNKQRGNITDAITKLLNHQETGKHRKDLPPRAAHKGQGVIQPIAFAHQQLFALGCFACEARKTQPHK